MKNDYSKTYSSLTSDFLNFATRTRRQLRDRGTWMPALTEDLEATATADRETAATDQVRDEKLLSIPPGSDERRRPGRVEYSPELTPLLRTSSLLNSYSPNQDGNPAKGIAIALAICVPFWAVLIYAVGALRN